MIKKHWEILIVLLIVLGSTVIKYWGIDKSPPSLGFDEAALGYNAYSIMKTGKDEYGNWLPLSLRSFNDYKPALYSYLSIPFIYFEGLNETSTRTVSVLAGGISLWFWYLILKKFVINKYWRVLGLFIIAFEPWRMHFSRNAFETNLSMCLFTVGVYFLFKAKRKWDYFWSVIFFGLATYSYHSARLSAPLLLIFMALDPFERIRKKDLWGEMCKYLKNNYKKFIPIIGIFLVCLPIFIMNSGSLLLTRFNQENLFKAFYPYTPKELITTKNPFLDWKANPIYYFGGIVMGHVLSYVSPINLNYRIFSWIKGSPQFIPGMSMLGWIEGMMVLAGLAVTLKNLFNDRKYRLLIYWIVAGVAPAAATWTWFHSLRALNIFPALEILAILGIIRICQLLSKKIKINLVKFGLAGAGILLMVMTSVYTINNEVLYSPYENNGEYQPGGYKEGMSYLKNIQNEYDQVIIDTPHAQPFVFLMFYQAMDPVYVQSFAEVRPKPGVGGNLIFPFGKFVFRKIDWPNDQKLKKTVFWTRGDITKEEVERVPGAKIRKEVTNVLYHTADIITIE